ncbi:uncharacterized protein LOC6645020 [Drosophila willistoni]|nr:uncharacterized protein LOC6645020 [Drosophila willistoni]
MSDSLSNSVPPIRIPETDSEDDENNWNLQLRQRYGPLLNPWLPISIPSQSTSLLFTNGRYRNVYECGPLTDHEKHQMILLNEWKKRTLDQKLDMDDDDDDNDDDDQDDQVQSGAIESDLPQNPNA